MNSATPGIPSAAVIALIDSLSAEGLDPHALAIARHGEVLTSHAWAPWATDRPALSYSSSKTFTSLAIGLLEGEGRLSLEDSAGDLLGLPNPHGITVRHLLTMNTGHSQAQADTFDFDVATLLSTPPAAAPGTSFAYNSDATYALSCIVTALTGERLTDYLRPRLLDPLGIGRRWMKPARGIEQGASGFHLTVGDLAQVGILLGAGGRFGGAQVVPAGYVDELARPWSDTRDPSQPDDPENDWAYGYGYQVWRGRHGFRVDGAYGQFAVVLPAHDLVIAYQGATLDTPRTMRAFWRFLEAVDVADAAANAADDADDAAPTIAGTERRDSWDSRERLAPAPDGDRDATGIRLTEASEASEASEGWTLTLPAHITGGDVQDVAVGATGWARTVLSLAEAPSPAAPVVSGPAVDEGARVVVAARGTADADGILVHVVVATSPHRLIVRRAADGRITAGWHTVPLRGGMLATVAVPAWLADDVAG